MTSINLGDEDVDFQSYSGARRKALMVAWLLADQLVRTAKPTEINLIIETMGQWARRRNTEPRLDAEDWLRRGIIMWLEVLEISAPDYLEQARQELASQGLFIVAREQFIVAEPDVSVGDGYTVTLDLDVNNKAKIWVGTTPYTVSEFWISVTMEPLRPVILSLFEESIKAGLFGRMRSVVIGALQTMNDATIQLSNDPALSGRIAEMLAQAEVWKVFKPRPFRPRLLDQDTLDRLKAAMEDPGLNFFSRGKPHERSSTEGRSPSRPNPKLKKEKGQLAEAQR